MRFIKYRQLQNWAINNPTFLSFCQKYFPHRSYEVIFAKQSKQFDKWKPIIYSWSICQSVNQSILNRSSRAHCPPVDLPAIELPIRLGCLHDDVLRWLTQPSRCLKRHSWRCRWGSSHKGHTCSAFALGYMGTTTTIITRTGRHTVSPGPTRWWWFQHGQLPDHTH